MLKHSESGRLTDTQFLTHFATNATVPGHSFQYDLLLVEGSNLLFTKVGTVASW